MNLRTVLIRLVASTCVWICVFMYIESSAKPTDKKNKTNAETSSKDSIRRIVCFKFKEDADPLEIKKVEREFAALKIKISGIRSFELGINNSPEGLNKGFTHFFIVTFDNEEARTNYLPHPYHQAFVSILKPILDDVFVIDFNP